MNVIIIEENELPDRKHFQVLETCLVYQYKPDLGQPVTESV